jgi:hypothetical protein
MLHESKCWTATLVHITLKGSLAIKGSIEVIYTESFTLKEPNFFPASAALCSFAGWWL